MAQTEQMVGRVAVYDGWAADGNGYTIPLSYRVETEFYSARDVGGIWEFSYILLQDKLTRSFFNFAVKKGFQYRLFVVY